MFFCSSTVSYHMITHSVFSNFLKDQISIFSLRYRKQGLVKVNKYVYKVNESIVYWLYEAMVNSIIIYLGKRPHTPIFNEWLSINYRIWRYSVHSTIWLRKLLSDFGKLSIWMIICRNVRTLWLHSGLPGNVLSSLTVVLLSFWTFTKMGQSLQGRVEVGW